MISLKELVSGKRILSEYEAYINQDPPKEWIVKLPDKKNVGEELDHLPENKVVILLNAIYGVDGWREEVLREHIARSATLTNEHTTLFITRLHIRNPETGIWNYFDGVGGASTIGESEAYSLQQCAQYSIPNATMNAARKIGRVFGGELYEESKKRNAASRIVIENSKAKNSKVKTEAEKVISQILKTQTGEGLTGFRETIENLVSESAVDSSEVEAMTQALEDRFHLIQMRKDSGKKEKEIAEIGNTIIDFGKQATGQFISDFTQKIGTVKVKKKLKENVENYVRKTLSIPKEKKKKIPPYDEVLESIRQRKRGGFLNIGSKIDFLFQKESLSKEQKDYLLAEIELQKKLINIQKK